MLSMGDVFSIDELMDFNQRQQDNGDVSVTPEYNLELKIDGLSLSLVTKMAGWSRDRPGETGISGKMSRLTS